jgi:hypothetical protein
LGGAEYSRNVREQAAEERDVKGELSLQVGTTLRS